jgi:hypothetical protein
VTSIWFWKAFGAVELYFSASGISYYLDCKKMKVAFVLGTRPEIVKLAPVIHACLNDSTMQVRIIHTNQHFSESMDSVFFLDL